MVDCNLCGKKATLITARIDGVLLKVCKDCAQAGKIIEINKPIKTQFKMQRKTQAEEMVIPNFVQEIRQARQHRNMKQEAVAKALNEKVSVINSVENGRIVPDLKLAKKLERFFGIKLIEIE